MQFYKRLVKTAVAVLIITATLSCALLFSACNKQREKDFPYIFNGFSVHYIDVGEGDSIFINLPDGKTMLIDTGEKSDKNLAQIKKVLTDYNVSKIDYLLLTHTDEDHIGNAVEIINGYDIGKAFIPHVREKLLSVFTAFSEVNTALSQKGVITEYSSFLVDLTSEDYVLRFLSPLSKEYYLDAYGEMNGSDTPSAESVNNVCPYVYLEYKGVRFLFCGDAQESAEKDLLANYSQKLYTNVAHAVNLDEITFLKVSHHGANDATSADFLEVVKPVNAVISVGGINAYRHPSTNTLYRLYAVNPDCNILRTDVCGGISVCVRDNGSYFVKIKADI